MDFILTGIVIKSDLTDVLYTESLQKPLPSFRNEMPVCDIKRPLEIRRTKCIEKPVCLFNIMGDIMDFGVFGFSVVVLKEDDYLCLFCPRDQSLDAFNRSITALREGGDSRRGTRTKWLSRMIRGMGSWRLTVLITRLPDSMSSALRSIRSTIARRTGIKLSGS